MRFLVISGLSGSGKSIALQSLEDLDYYCVDNLPLSLLLSFAQTVMTADKLGHESVAVGIDARNLTNDMGRFPTIMDEIRKLGFECEVIFLEAGDVVLKKRFSETRRKHPLTDERTSLDEAIKAERKLLELIEKSADIHVDTSLSNVHQLRALIRDYVRADVTAQLSLQFMSFGFKQGVPGDVDFVFDVRCLPNPYWDPKLRTHRGTDRPVIDFLDAQVGVNQMFEDLSGFLQRWIPEFEKENRSYLSVAIGCTGGQHRSVYIVERLEAHFRALNKHVIVRHRDLQ